MIDRRHFIGAGTAAALWPLAARADEAPLDITRILSGFPPGRHGGRGGPARRRQAAWRLCQDDAGGEQARRGAAGWRSRNCAAPPADGSSLLITPAAMITLYPHLYKKLGYGLDDVTPVCGVTSVVFGLGSRAGGAGQRGHAEGLHLLGTGPSQPGQLRLARRGLAAPLRRRVARQGNRPGPQPRALPRHGCPASRTCSAGSCPSFSGPIGDYLPHVKTGKLRVLATSGPRRSRFLPDVPTYGELGFKALEQTEWLWLLPAGQGLAGAGQAHRGRGAGGPRGTGDAAGARAVRASRWR